MIPGQFDSLTKTLPRESRRSALRTLGGMLALVPGVAAANANQRSGGRTDDDGDGRRRRKRLSSADSWEKHHDGDVRSAKLSKGRGVCRDTCPRGAVTVAPTEQGECRCAPVSPGLRDPEFTCGGRVNESGDGCCFCLFTVEGEGFCAVNTACDVLAASLVTDCTSSGDCPRGRKCIPVQPNLVEPLPTAGVCWPECHTTEGVSEIRS